MVIVIFPHMLGLYPGDLIAQNDEWLAAAKVSMQNRTDVTTGMGDGSACRNMGETCRGR